MSIWWVERQDFIAAASVMSAWTKVMLGWVVRDEVLWGLEGGD